MFRAVALRGRISNVALGDDSAGRQIAKRYARRVGLDPISYAGCSRRSEFQHASDVPPTWEYAPHRY